MSMRLLSAQAPPDLPESALIYLGLALLALTILSPLLAWATGVFRPGNIHGPGRRGGDESVLRLVLILVGAFVIFFAATVAAMPLLEDLPAAQREFAAGSIGMLGGFVAILILNGLGRERGTRRIGLNVGRIMPGLLIGALGLLIVIPWVMWSVQVSELVWRQIDPDPDLEHGLFRMWREADPMFRYFAVVSAVIIAPLAEEVAFRGVIQTILTRLMGPWLSIFLTSVLFALIHQPPAIQLPIFILSLGMGYLYERTGNLWAPIFMHMLFNAGQMLLFIFVLEAV